MRVWPFIFASLTVGTLGTLGCSANPARPLAAAREEPREAPPPPVPWPRFAEVRSWPSVAPPFENDGHAGAGAQVSIRVSPDARASYLGLVRDSVLADGALVAAFHDEGGARPGLVYVMEKADGHWLFRALHADGTLVTRGATFEALGACAGCHAGGVADALFGLPARVAPP